MVGDANEARSQMGDRTTGIAQGIRFSECFPSTLRNLRGMRFAAVFCAALLLVSGAAAVGAQNTAQDLIDRNLLLRQQQEQDLQNRLDDATRNGMPGVQAQPPASGSLAAPQLAPPQLPSADVQSQQLYQSQQQRQLEQQNQNRFLSAPLQEQQNQIQLQQFQREDQAQQLEREIQGSSSRTVPGLH